ncbi:LysE family translocator [Serratia sp. DD3]|uniref:LysE family translocator n=1 Tax=Serratia sp. DD3 TaxID=1410619 RepID=UPI0003C50572|nr:LysE family translocator [Serratia sp. DD3]KEY57402.1 cysteine/O-acetylserine efflux protein [Serratia sp. DD3]
MTIYFSMAAFALATSITPGPVNIVAFANGAQVGFYASLRHVTGATVGFTLLLILVGLGLNQILIRWPGLTAAILWAGVLFLLYMAYQLAVDSGQWQQDQHTKRPSYWYGAGLQWLNPKAWLAATAGMGAFVGDSGEGLLWQFALIYFVICYASVAIWVCAGSMLSRFLQRAHIVRYFNRLMALLLVLSASYLVVEGV